MNSSVDPARLGVYAEIFETVCEEMGELLKKTAESPNIKTRRDYSCAICLDGEHGVETAAQAAHIPVHLGSLDLSVEALIDAGIGAGEIGILNDPFNGGTHLPDITLAVEAIPNVWCVVRAHHADVGGAQAGSMGGAKSIEEEGFLIPPSRFDGDIVDRFVRRSRGGEQRRGDLLAQEAAVKHGAKRIRELSESLSVPEILLLILGDSAEAYRRRIQELDFSPSEAEDEIEDPGGMLKLKLRIEKESESTLLFDFTGTEGPSRAALNAPLSVTRSAVLYALQTIIRPKETLITSAPLRFIRIKAPEGSILNATYPMAVAGGNVETSQRAVDLIYQALARIIEGVPAAGQGTMNNLTLGGDDWAYYETIAGGMGASAAGPGADAIQVHMTNTLNTWTEEIEREFPIRVLEHSVRRGSGGAGRHRGGDGVVKVYEVLSPCEASILATRRRSSPPGAAGGEDGLSGRDTIIRRDGSSEGFEGTARLHPGDRIRIETPGGGGVGKS